MTPEEYAARQAVITAAVAAAVYQIAQFWSAVVITPAEWIRLLRFLWPEVQQRRRESAQLARDFYDSQRATYFPQLPRQPIDLQGSDFGVFVKNMEPVRAKMSMADSPRDAVTMMSLLVVREVENAGRRQIIQAVKDDDAVAEAIQTPVIPEGRRTLPFTDAQKNELLAILDSGKPRDRATWGGQTVEEPANLRNTRRQIATAGRSNLVRGWARVATGDETCGWCLMLVSRGPVYLEAATAGLNRNDESAIDMFRESDIETYGIDTAEFMEEWHTGCDCKVIPVFKTDDWENSRFGRAAQFALNLWNDASADAEREMEKRGTRVHLTGKNKGDDITFNEEAILALRRRLYAGDINPSEYSAFAA